MLPIEFECVCVICVGMEDKGKLFQSGPNTANAEPGREEQDTAEDLNVTLDLNDTTEIDLDFLPETQVGGRVSSDSKERSSSGGQLLLTSSSSIVDTPDSLNDDTTQPASNSPDSREDDITNPSTTSATRSNTSATASVTQFLTPSVSPAPTISPPVPKQYPANLFSKEGNQPNSKIIGQPDVVSPSAFLTVDDLSASISKALKTKSKDEYDYLFEPQKIKCTGEDSLDKAPCVRTDVSNNTSSKDTIADLNQYNKGKSGVGEYVRAVAPPLLKDLKKAESLSLTETSTKDNSASGSSSSVTITSDEYRRFLALKDPTVGVKKPNVESSPTLVTNQPLTFIQRGNVEEPFVRLISCPTSPRLSLTRNTASFQKQNIVQSPKIRHKSDHSKSVFKNGRQYQQVRTDGSCPNTPDKRLFRESHSDEGRSPSRSLDRRKNKITEHRVHPIRNGFASVSKPYSSTKDNQTANTEDYSLEDILGSTDRMLATLSDVEEFEMIDGMESDSEDESEQRRKLLSDVSFRATI